MIISGCLSDEIPFNNATPIIVVEGWLTDQPGNQYVRISQTQSFNSSEASPTIDNATVYTKSIGGDSMIYAFVGNGRYESSEVFSGRRNFSYQLFIELSDGRVISSSIERMRTAPVIDSLFYDSYERESEENPNIIETVYFPKAQIQDTEGIENYYRWRVFRNDTLFSEPEHIVLINDRFFDGNSPTLENEFTIFEYFQDDSIGLELQEISQRAYEYLRLLKSQTTTIGTVSSVTPASIDGNLTFQNSDDEVLGFWGVVSVNSAGIKIIQ
ncbi:MAG: DUF4249 family protein [Marinoscillum sp.]